MELEFDLLPAQGLARYIRLVAHELGLNGNSSFVQWEPAASGYLAIDYRHPLFPARDAALIWDEEHGWATGIETHSGEDLIGLSYLGNDILPAPEVVAGFVRDSFAGEFPGQAEPPVFRQANDDDDLYARLARYARTDIPAYPNPVTRSAGNAVRRSAIPR